MWILNTIRTHRNLLRNLMVEIYLPHVVSLQSNLSLDDVELQTVACQDEVACLQPIVVALHRNALARDMTGVLVLQMA